MSSSSAPGVSTRARTASIAATTPAATAWSRPRPASRASTGSTSSPATTRSITGLSKISRVIQYLCRRPQIQERITTEVMRLEPVGVLVDLVAEHTCMRVRGVEDPCSSTRTRVLGSRFERDPDLRGQALAMLE